MTVLLLVCSVAAGSLFLPLGLLPSILGFRDLANGLDGSERTKRAYAATLWGGLGSAWALGAVASYLALRLVFG